MAMIAVMAVTCIGGRPAILQSMLMPAVSGICARRREKNNKGGNQHGK
jgi:hypothetical protein